MSGSGVIDRTSVREQVGRLLRAQIASGTLLPGEIYSAVALGEAAGVSATPIREAMIDLARSGLVEPVRNRGFRILEISDDDLDEIVALRLMLEVPPLEAVIERASDEQLAALESHIEPIMEAARQRDLANFLLIDSAFHLALLELAGNSRLVNLVSELRDETRLLGLRRLSETGKLVASSQEHEEILAAIRERDVELSKALMTRHIRHARGVWAGRNENESD